MADPDVFVEAGAHDASTSLRVADSGVQRVLAFEANPVNHEHFSGMVDFRSRGVEYVHAALTDHAGPVVLHREVGLDGDPFVGHSSLAHRNHDVSPVPTPVKDVSVDGIRLDDAVGDCSRSALWVDVEGFNGPVLAGGPELLRRCAVLKIEVEDVEMWHEQALAVDVLGTLLEAGLVPVARDVQSPGQYNIVAVSSDMSRQDGVMEQVERFHHLARQRQSPALVDVARKSPAYGRASRFVRGMVRLR
ncbi:FkbM family methyltransferase [Nocardioides sp.]|uniref:FkbM family methyltransferase n=1 Tax=Nocardioides sp. TaxID=35761 RepID=UPI00286DD9BC|nr:FkbM family methyltransferase [Nocardioides sp.]